MVDSSGFVRALLSKGPAPGHSDAMNLYAFLIGDWTFAATVNRDDGSVHHGQGEIHAVWALEGRAVQDVWILPGLFYGTTLRVFDPALNAWHILWNDPLKQYYTRQLGRARGGDIVQEGETDKGLPVRWSFVERDSDSFRWLGEYSPDGRASWTLQADFRVRRVS